MILADDTVWRSWGELTIWFAGVATAIGVLSRTRPVRWLWRRLISGPFTEWFRKTGGDIIEEKVGKEFASNGGASLRDAIDGLKEGQASLAEGHAAIHEAQEAAVEQIGEVQAAVVDIAASVGTTLADHGARITATENGQRDVLAAIDKLHKCIERRLTSEGTGPADRRTDDPEPAEAENETVEATP